MYNKIVIGLDQSYARTGISIAADGKLLKVSYTEFKGCKTNIEKRKHLNKILLHIIETNKNKTKNMFIICERIRVFSGGRGANPTFLKSTGALVASITDLAYDYNIPVFSVDTRAWKTQVVGTAKIKDKWLKEIKPEKMEAIKFIAKLGFDCKEYSLDGSIKRSIKGKNKGKIKYIDDKADSACMALYGFVPSSKQKLELET